ncbi:hypothetical protein TNCV_4510941 [Trichonephila clavipes]|nr:hypothetical protein TNCV_4510941 [Trichonephila clavipes]
MNPAMADMLTRPAISTRDGAQSQRKDVPRALKITGDAYEFHYTRAFGDGPRNLEPWSSDVDDTRADTPSLNYHTNGRTFQLSTDLTCIAALHGGSSVVLGSNS